MKRLILFSLSACALFAQGVVQQNTQQIGPQGGQLVNLYAVSFNWTADGSGVVPVTAVNSSGFFQGWRVIAAEFAPRTPAPTANYSIQLLDGVGVDLLGSAAIALSASAAQSFTIPATPPPLYGTFSLSLTGNAIAGARGAVVVYLAPAPVVTFTVGGSAGGSSGGAVSSVFGRTGAVVAALNDYSFSLLSGVLATSQVGTPQGNGSKVQLSTGATVTNDCVKFDANGNTVDSGAPCATGGVTTAGSPAIGNLTKFSGASSITNGDLSGDCTTSGTLGVTCTKMNGVTVPASQNPVSTNGSGQFVAPTVQGNGPKVQLSTGTTATNNCTKYDANGNTVDAGAPCSTATGTLSVSGPYITDGSTKYLMFPTLHSVTPPVTGNFSFLSAQGSATATNTTGGGIYLEDFNAATNIRLYGETKSPTYTITVDIYFGLTASQNWTGIAISDGTKFETFGPNFNAGTGRMVVATWTNSTTFSATPFSQISGFAAASGLYSPGFITLKLADNGTNRTWAYSINGGSTFYQVLSEASNLFLTPTQFGIFVLNTSGTAFMTSTWLLNCTGC